MRIATLAAADSVLTNKEIEVSVHKLRFKFSNTQATLAEVISPDAATLLTSLIGNTKINLQKQDGYSTTSLQQELLLKDIAEVSTHNDGLLKITRVYDGSVAGNNVASVEFTVEIANGHAYELNDKSKLILNISGKPTTNSCTLDIDAIDYPVNGREFIKYENKFVNANVAKDFEVTGAYAISLPAGNIVSLELHYANAKVVKLTQDEIKMTLIDSQDIIATVNNKTIFGYINFATLSLMDVWKVNVTLDTSTNFYLLSEQI